MSQRLQEEDFRESYGEKRAIREAANRRNRLWPEILQHLPPVVSEEKIPSTLLDVGCGYGDFLLAAQDAGWDIAGIEINPTMRKVCGERSIRVYDRPLAELTSLTESIRAVTYLNVLDSIPDPIAELKLARQIMVRGGRILLRIPNGAVHGGILRRLSRHGTVPEWYLRGERTPLNEWIFHPEGIARVLSRCGFEDIQFLPSRSGSGGILARKGVGFLRFVGKILRSPYPLSSSLLVSARVPIK